MRKTKIRKWIRHHNYWIFGCVNVLIFVLALSFIKPFIRHNHNASRQRHGDQSANQSISQSTSATFSASSDIINSIFTSKLTSQINGEPLCKIPVMIHALELDHPSFQTSHLDCANNNVNNLTMFTIDLDGNLKRLKKKDTTFWENWCYFQSFQRIPDKPDFLYKISPVVQQITQDLTLLKSHGEFISVFCYNKSNPFFKGQQPKIEQMKNSKRIQKLKKHTIYEDQLHWFPIESFLGSSKNIKVKKDTNNSVIIPDPYSDPNPHSVIILGIGSLSAGNFIRHMRKSEKFLREDLDAFRFDGYNSLGQSTALNFYPLTLGQSFQEATLAFPLGCSKNQSKTGYDFDQCLSIWKAFKTHGFLTSLAMDSLNWTGAPIFKQKPVDFDFRDFIRLASSNRKARRKTALNSKVGRNMKKMNSSGFCSESGFQFEILTENLLKFTNAMEKMKSQKKNESKNGQTVIKYFHLTWANELLQNVNENSDSILEDTLKKLKAQGTLDNSILILVSDHGPIFHRGDSRRETTQGFLEERLPLFYIYLPPNFKTKYPLAVMNMKMNTKRFTTAFDIHETLLDLLDPEKNLRHDKIRKRSLGILSGNDDGMVTSKVKHSQYSHHWKKVSLFLQVPLGRTCDSIGLMNENPSYSYSFCTCHTRVKTSLNNEDVQKGAELMVTDINRQLREHGLFDLDLNPGRKLKSKCSLLHLSKITSANRLQPQLENHSEQIPATTHNNSTTTVLKNAENGNETVQERIARLKDIVYEIQIETEPGKGQFFGSVLISISDSDEMIEGQVMNISRLHSNSDSDGEETDGKCLKGTLSTFDVKRLKQFCECN